MSVDQHMLVALAAPRRLHCFRRRNLRQILGAISFHLVLNNLQTIGYGLGNRTTFVNEPVHGRIGYHVRNGRHDVTDYDWKRYLKFADL